MGYEARVERATRAENEVRNIFEQYDWIISRYNIRSALTAQHNEFLSLNRLTDPPSLFIRHFPDHIATHRTQKKSIFVQTKWAQPDYPNFLIEADSAHALNALPFQQNTLLVYWIEEKNSFWALSFDNVRKLLANRDPSYEGGRGGSGTPYYLLPRSAFLPLVHYFNLPP